MYFWECLKFVHFRVGELLTRLVSSSPGEHPAGGGQRTTHTASTNSPPCNGDAECERTRTCYDGFCGKCRLLVLPCEAARRQSEASTTIYGIGVLPSWGLVARGVRR